MPANSLRPMETRNNVIPHRHTETHEQNGHSIHYRKYNGNGHSIEPQHFRYFTGTTTRGTKQRMSWLERVE